MINQASNKSENPRSVWKVLSSSGCPSLHKANKIVLEKMAVAGKSIKVVESHTFEDSKEVLNNNPDIALIILDIVNENFGSDLIKYVRNNQNNKKVRLILLTGYPDYLPDKDIISNYEVDGCISKEELTEDKIEFTIANAIHTYNRIEMVANYMQSLAGSIAHELRTPLNFFYVNFIALQKTMGSYESSMEQNDIDTLKRLIRMGRNVFDRTNQIIDITLKNISGQKVDQRKFKIIMARDTVLTGIADYTFYKEEDKEKVNVSEGDFKINGDQSLLIFVLFNLLKNSLYYIKNKPKGKISISFELGEKYNKILFRDNGPGISEERLPIIFDDFATAGKEDGTGLGLSFCKRVMEDMNGKINCKSELKKWTEFTLSFPTIG